MDLLAPARFNAKIDTLNGANLVKPSMSNFFLRVCSFLNSISD